MWCSRTSSRRSSLTPHGDSSVSATHIFFSWIFGFGGKVRIKGPEKIKTDYKEMVSRALSSLWHNNIGISTIKSYSDARRPGLYRKSRLLPPRGIYCWRWWRRIRASPSFADHWWKSYTAAGASAFHWKSQSSHGPCGWSRKRTAVCPEPQKAFGISARKCNTTLNLKDIQMCQNML